MKSSLWMEDALAGCGPHMGHRSDDVEAVIDGVVASPECGPGGDGSRVSVGAVECSFPIVVPVVVAKEDSGAELASAEHDPVFGGLCV